MSKIRMNGAFAAMAATLAGMARFSSLGGLMPGGGPTIQREYTPSTTSEIERKMALSKMRNEQERMEKAKARHARREARRKGGNNA